MTTSVREITPVDPARVEQVRKSGLKADHATALSGTLSLLAEPTRLRILYALTRSTRCAWATLRWPLAAVRTPRRTR